MSRQMYLDEESGQLFPVSDEPVRKKQTNADRIRNMGDTELANFLSGLCDGCINCPMYYCKSEEDDECMKRCNSAWQEWVRKEAE